MLKKIISLSLLAMSTAAHASGGYVGGSLGESSTDLTAVYAPLPGETVSVSDSDTAFKVFGGYEFSDVFAVEGGYASFGEFRVDYADAGGITFSETRDAGAFYAAAVGTIPLGPVSLFGKAGLAHWFVDYAFYDTLGLWWSESATGIEPMVGLGVKLNLAPNFELRAEAERFMDVGDASLSDQSDIDVLSLGAAFKF